MPGSRPKLFVTAGQRIGRGVVVDPEIRIGKTAIRGARLRCDCGSEYTARMFALVGTNSDIRSCGCYQRECVASVRTSHGLSRHLLYSTWSGMLSRCEDPQHQAYRWYGARGIKVCARWHDVRLFVEDIERDLGPRPDGMSIDRVDNDGNYEPGNVRWATPVQQAGNRRPAVAGVMS